MCYVQEHALHIGIFNPSIALREDALGEEALIDATLACQWSCRAVRRGPEHDDG